MRRWRHPLWSGWFGSSVLVACALSVAWIRLATPTADAQGAPRSFSGTFAGSGTFGNSLCTWRTTYSGTVDLVLTFGATGVTGTARHRGSYQDVLIGGPSECGGDLSGFNETVPVTGTAQALSWGYGHGEAGRVAVTGSLIGTAIVGRGTVTDPDFSGSATIPFTATEVGGGPPAEEAPAKPPTTAPPPPPAPQAVPAAPAPQPSAPVPSAAGPAAPAPAAAPPPPAPGPTAAEPPAGIVGAAPLVPTLAPIPPVPPPKEAVPTSPTIDRDACQNFSSDPELWQALEDHLDELDAEDTPIGAVKSCLSFYRFAPWPKAPGGATAGEPDERKPPDQAGDRDRTQEPPPKATLQTVTAFVLKAGEQGRTSTVQGATLGKGDIVLTKDQSATVDFSEGTRLELGAKSAVVMGDPAEKAVLQLRGRMFMDVKSRQWHVRIPQPRGLVSVVTRGTVLTTEARDDGMVWIEVTEGSVEVTSAGGSVTVMAGSSVTVDPSLPPPAPAKTATSDRRQLALFGVATTIALAAAAVGVLVVLRRRTARRV